MKTEIDMWGTARKMREVYGAFAVATAAKRARQAEGLGDRAGHERWRQIARIISAGAPEQPAE
jgi:hypothetical protein